MLTSRPDWYQNSTPNGTANLVWMPLSKSINYNSLKEKNKIQLVNHFYHHQEISTKHMMFQNLSVLCELNKWNVFDYVPLTFVLDKNKLLYNNNFQKLTHCINLLSESSSLFNSSYYFESRAQILECINTKLSNYSTSMRQDIIRSCKPNLTKSQFVGKNLWIFKPSNLNRGRGVVVFNSLSQLNKILQSYEREDKRASAHHEFSDVNKRILSSYMGYLTQKDSYLNNVYVVQKYIEDPLLINGRKFDIRVWVLLSHDMKAYFYKEGYLRLSSYKYSTDVNSREIHLTNNAVQKFTKEYGQNEDGNQMSFEQFQEYLNNSYIHLNVKNDLYPKMVKYTSVLLQSVRKKLNPNELHFSFEIFGLDFMIDSDLGLWLIEVNTNPCLEESSNILKALIPRMVNDSFKLTVDVICPRKRPVKEAFTLDKYSDDENLWDEIS